MNEILCYTEDEEGAREEIARAGGRVTHTLTPSVLVVELPPGTTLTTCLTAPPPTLDETSARVAAAWKIARAKPAPAEIIPWDTEGFEPPD